MIILPTRQRLERRRDSLYRRLQSVIHNASVHEVEDIMRKVHIINLKLRTYFIREGQHEAADTFETEDTVEAEELTLSQINEALGEIEI